MLKEYQEEKNKLSYYTPYVMLVDKGIVMNRNGTLQKTFKYRGYDLDNETLEGLKNSNFKLNNVIKRLGSNWIINVDVRRIKKNEYIKSEYSCYAGELIEQERYKYFMEGNHYESEYYLTISYLTPTDKKKKMNSFLIKSTHKKEEENLEKEIVEFKKNVKNISDLLSTVFLEIEELTDEETYTYLHSCVSEKDHNIKVPEIPLYISNYICDTKLIGGLKPQLGKKHLRAISLLGFPQMTEPGFFDRLNRLNIEYRWVTRFLSLDKVEAISILNKKWNTAFSERLNMLKQATNKEQTVNGAAEIKAAGIDLQRTATRSDILSQGYYTCTILLTDEEVSQVEKKVEIISKIINEMGFVTIEESTNTVECFLGAMPGNISNNVREPLLNSLTLSHLFAVSSIWSGDKYNKHLNAPPLIYTETSGSTPFRFNLHVGDVGHTSIVGPTGAGKSVFLGVIASQFSKYKNSQVYIFDKGGSSRILTYAFGGDFYNLGEDSLSFQPLANIDNTLEREWANEWILDIMTQENIIITPVIKEKIWEALQLVASSPKELRTLTTLSTMVTDKEIQGALSSYIVTGALGKYFDSNEDNLNFGRWQVFEMERIMQNKQAVVPLLTYLFHKIEQRMDGSPTIIILDECWMFFDNPIFSAKIREWLKVLRKKNTSVIFATQELGDILSSSLFPTILDACKTKVFLPNSNAEAENYIPVYEKFGLNKREIEIIAQAINKKEYYVKTEKGARKFQLSLGKDTLKLVASSEVEEQVLASEIKKETSNCDDFTKIWLNTILIKKEKNNEEK